MYNKILLIQESKIQCSGNQRSCSKLDGCCCGVWLVSDGRNEMGWNDLDLDYVTACYLGGEVVGW